MKTDTAIKHEGFTVLKKKLGIVNMERFIVLINREKLDYTKWRKDLCEDMNIDALAEEAGEYSANLEAPRNQA
jgi:hypothetical protein